MISVSVNGAEIGSPTVQDQVCRIRLPSKEAQQTSAPSVVSNCLPRCGYGFVGMAELTLPEVFQTAGTLEWVVALPNGFDTQIHLQRPGNAEGSAGSKPVSEIRPHFEIPSSYLSGERPGASRIG